MLAGDLQALGLDGSIKATDDNITISWEDTGRAEGGVERAVTLLRSGDYARGIRLLQILEKLEPKNPHLHFNLGVDPDRRRPVTQSAIAGRRDKPWTGSGLCRDWRRCA